MSEQEIKKEKEALIASGWKISKRSEPTLQGCPDFLYPELQKLVYKTYIAYRETLADKNKFTISASIMKEIKDLMDSAGINSSSLTARIKTATLSGLSTELSGLTSQLEIAQKTFLSMEKSKAEGGGQMNNLLS